MSQYDFGTIDPNTKSGTALASDLNSWRNALHSTHSGSTAPSYITTGMLWVDSTSANLKIKMYDGAQSIDVGIIDATNNVARVAVDSAATSYITSTVAAQIKFVIASVDTATIRSTGLQFNIASPYIGDSSNNELLSFTTTASAVNQINIANSATGSFPTISAVGNDTNIGIILAPKGAGPVYNLVTTAATNTVIDVARIEAQSSGTPAAGIGSALLFAVETAAANVEIGARIEAITTDVTATSEDFDLVFKLMAAGATATEVMRLKSTNSVDFAAFSIGGTTITTTAAQLNFVTGVTSAIQTQLDAKIPLSADATITGGYVTTADNDGTFTTAGTYTPTPSGGNMKRIINNGAFTLAAPTATGDYSLVIQITNSATPGAITLSGFNRTVGDPFTVVNGADFFVTITKCNGFILASTVALQ